MSKYEHPRGNFWFADRVTEDDYDGVITPGFEWRVFIQLGGMVDHLSGQFPDKEAAETFIRDDVLGAEAELEMRKPVRKKLPSVQDRLWHERIVPAIVRRDKGVCWVCGHAGADSADHVFPRAEMTDEQKRTMIYDSANLRAIHQKPCEMCSALAEARGNKPIRCNPLRGAYSIERVRRIINERTGQALGEVQRPAEPEGRPWLVAPVPVDAKPVHRA